MEVKSKWLLVVLKWCLFIAWWGNFIQAAWQLYILAKVAVTNQHYGWGIPIKLPSHSMEHYYPSFYVGDTMISVSMHAASLSIITPNIIAIIVPIVMLILSKGLLIAILYNLRKIFNTFYNNEPFQYENIIRIKKIALYVGLNIPIYCILGIVQYIVLRSYTQKFSMVWWNFPITTYLEIATIIYITAEIIRYGLELKKENEEFI